jgi:hypothetical protein
MVVRTIMNRSVLYEDEGETGMQQNFSREEVALGRGGRLLPQHGLVRPVSVRQVWAGGESAH